MRNLVSVTFSKFKSHIENVQNDISEEEKQDWFRLGLDTFNKTRFSSHVHFLRKCLQARIIPNGFKLNFHSGTISGRLSRKLRKSTERCSFNLMRKVLEDYDKRLGLLSKNRVACKERLRSGTTQDTWRKLSTVIHELNRDLYQDLLVAKEKKLRDLDGDIFETEIEDSDNKVFRIPETVELSQEEEKILSKGLSFIPQTSRPDTFETLNDCEEFYRKVRLKAFFGNQDNEEGGEIGEEVEDLFEGISSNKLTRFDPDTKFFPAVQRYVDKCRKDIKAMDLQKKSNSSNFSKEEWKTLQKLKNRDDIVIKPADKGGQVCVWDKNMYIEEGYKQLGDGQFYEKLERDITADIQKDITTEIDGYIDKGKLPRYAKNLLVRNPRCSKFYMLPKIHKVGIPGRPIVSNISCPTYQISKFLSGILKPFVKSTPSFIRDTTHLLQKLQDFQFSSDSENNVLFTMDVKGLYTNIPNEDGLRALSHYLNSSNNVNIDTDCILRLAELVLTLNCMEFDGKYFKQISGTMMGSPFSVEYACLAMAFQEKLMFENYDGEKPVMYFRYIDDVFGVSTMDRNKLDDFVQYVNNFNPALKYTAQIGNSVNMLDTTLSICGNKINATLYTKPTDSHSYLHYDSCHPRSCKDSIPYSQLLRVKRICSDNKDSEVKMKEMCSFFKKRGYPSRVIIEAKRKVDRLDRSELLQETSKKDEDENNDRIKFPITYHPLNAKIAGIVTSNFESLKHNEEIGHLFESKPMVVKRRGKNLKDMLVRAKLRGEENIGTKKCGKSRCLTCKYISEEQVVIGPQCTFDVRFDFTCESAGIVYCIICKKCGDLYIGETGRKLKDRFKEHRLDVLHKREGKEVAEHFNSEGHSVEHMSVLGLLKEDGLIARKLKEQRCIAKLGCFLGKGMNTDFKFIGLVNDI